MTSPPASTRLRASRRRGRCLLGANVRRGAGCARQFWIPGCGIFRPWVDGRRSGPGRCLHSAVAPWSGPSGRFWDPLSIAMMYTHKFCRCPCDIYYRVQGPIRDSGARRPAIARRTIDCRGECLLWLINSGSQRTHERKCGAEARGNLQLPGRDSGDGGKSASELDARGSNGMGFSRPQQGAPSYRFPRQHARR